MKRELIYRINEAICINCGSCRRFCPVDTISYTHLQHQVKMDDCIGCTVCYAVCPVEVVEKMDGIYPVTLDSTNMARVQLHTLAKGPFHQYRRREAQTKRNSDTSLSSS
jgi:MinD superfamily P-loop ATPase